MKLIEIFPSLIFRTLRITASQMEVRFVAYYLFLKNKILTASGETKCT